MFPGVFPDANSRPAAVTAAARSTRMPKSRAAEGLAEGAVPLLEQFCPLIDRLEQF
jgi:hypothetical protein